MKISVLIPAYNEEQNIRRETIEGVRELTGNTGGNEKAKIDIIVIDDGSTDNTYARANKTGVKTIKLAQNIGKGALGVAKKLKETIICFLDADLKEALRKLQADRTYSGQ